MSRGKLVTDIDLIVAEELRAANAVPDEPTVGLALSGGGIRSASVCLGVVQALHERGLFERFDYLSTVSGGGYLGSAVTWLIHHGKLGKLDAFVRRMRSRGNYLDPDRPLGLMSLVGVVLRTVVVNLLVYLGLLVALFMAMRLVGLFPASGGINPLLVAAAVLAVLFVLAAAGYSVATAFSSPRLARLRYRARLAAQAWTARLLTVIVMLVAVGLLPGLATALGDYWDEAMAASGVAGIVVSAVTAVSKFMRATSAKGEGLAGSAVLAPVLAALAVYGILVLAYVLSAAIGPGWLPVVAGVALVVGWFSDMNLLSLHRMYRDRLMEAFQPNMQDLTSPVWTPATEANTAQLSKMAQRPYHLLNTNLILVDSKVMKQRGRGGESYVLAPLYSGAQTTGWYPTTDIFGTDDGLTLATAVAVSGAAVNAHASSDGQPGAMRNGAVSFLMTLFGLQLGYWAPNPSKGGATPSLLVPGLAALFGRGFRGSAMYHMLSDGGHFDNTGVYELIHRRVATIVAVDGSADPGFQFADLSAMAEKVSADFGVRIRFPGTLGTLADLPPQVPCSDFPHLEVAKRGWIQGVIDYPDHRGKPAFTGRLIYAKSTLLSGLPFHVYGYQAANKTFPNQSTGDQFFDEDQLESYRAVGYALGQALPQV